MLFRSGLASGTYNFTVSNSTLCTSPASANAVVNAQPVTPSVTNQAITTMTGVIFLVNPTGVPSGTTYSWPAPTYTNGVTGGSSATNQTSISQTLTLATGTGTATYVVTPTSGACVGATFTVTVTVNTVCTPVSIGSQPSNNSICAVSGNTNLTVSANGTTPFVYQWQYHNGSTWGNVTNGTPAGATYTNPATSALSIAGITAAGAYQYRCYITNCSGNNNATSNPVTLTVLPLPTKPTVGNIVQTNCTHSTASVVFDSLPATGNWIINPGNYTGFGSSTTLYGIPSGSYNFKVTNSVGCTSDTTASVVINPQPVTPPAPTVTSTNNILHSDATTGNQWYNSNGIILGATGQTFAPVTNSGYYDIVTINGCSSVPSNIIQTNVGIESIENMKFLQVYPNPVSNTLTLELKGNNQNIHFEVLNSLGQVILKNQMLEKLTISTSDFVKGIYLLKIENGGTFEFRKIIKE